MDKEARSGTFTDNMKLPIHRWFRYSAGFSAEWAKTIIEQEKVGSKLTVLDPFAGSGATHRWSGSRLSPAAGHRPTFMLPLLTAPAVTPAVIVANNLIAPVAPTCWMWAFRLTLAQHGGRLALDVVLRLVCVIHGRRLAPALWR